MSDQLRAELEAAGRDIAAAEAGRAKALERVAIAVKAAEGEVPIREMARLTGVSHVTLYKMLEK